MPPERKQAGQQQPQYFCDFLTTALTMMKWQQ